MKMTFRATTPHDGPAIVAFFCEVLGRRPDDPRFDPRLLHWKYWLERSDWPGPRSHVLARGDEILAHAAVVPGRYLWQGGALRTIHLIDWAARPGVAGAGRTLMKHIGRATDALLAIGGSELTLQILPTIGFKHDGDAIGYVRSVRPLRRLIGTSSRNWRLAYQFARSVAWTIAASSRYEGIWTVQRVTPEDLESANLPQPVPGPGTAVLERTTASFAYWLACPTTPMALYEIRKTGSRARGYFLLALLPGQARLADCWVDSDDAADWRALVQLAVRTSLADRRIAEVVARSNGPMLSASLLDCGFHARRTEPVQLLTMAGSASPPVRVHVQMIDNDAAWIDTGTIDFWA